jgi:hypothetical protein
MHPCVLSQDSFVHLFPSAQERGLFTHFPVLESQLSMVHASWSSQLIGVYAHFPDLVSQATVWQFCCWHTTGVKTQFPLTQESVVHKLLSSQTTEENWHPFTTSQEPIEHLFPLSQTIGVCSIPFSIEQESLVHAL